MKDKLEEIEKVLIEEDPVKLIKMGAPDDEYSHEALMIYERTNRYHSMYQIHQIVYDVFFAQFRGGRNEDEFTPKLIGHFEDYKEIALKIKQVVGY